MVNTAGPRCLCQSVAVGPSAQKGLPRIATDLSSVKATRKSTGAASIKLFPKSRSCRLPPMARATAGSVRRMALRFSRRLRSDVQWATSGTSRNRLSDSDNVSRDFGKARFGMDVSALCERTKVVSEFTLCPRSCSASTDDRWLLFASSTCTPSAERRDDKMASARRAQPVCSSSLEVGGRRVAETSSTRTCRAGGPALSAAVAPAPRALATASKCGHIGLCPNLSEMSGEAARAMDTRPAESLS
mmetsp:Transcript_112/g.325  ORF Transcript_112/g.325 Transcript_112/m.325 type:complete len:245 (+) Transcript_112:297-1031(+)